jgi:hypothetical protein
MFLFYFIINILNFNYVVEINPLFIRFSTIDGKFCWSNGEGCEGRINPGPINVPGLLITKLFIEGIHLLIAK